MASTKEFPAQAKLNSLLEMIPSSAFQTRKDSKPIKQEIKQNPNRIIKLSFLYEERKEEEQDYFYF